MVAQPRKRLGEILMDEGILTDFQVNTALTEQKKWGGKLGETLIRLGYLTEEEMLNALRNQLKIPSVNLLKSRIPQDLIEKLPQDILRKHEVLPVGVREINGREYLVIAMSDPANLMAIDEIQFSTSMNLLPALAGPMTLQRAIKYYLDQEGDLFSEEDDLNVREKVDISTGNRTLRGEESPEENINALPPNPNFQPAQAFAPDAIPVDQARAPAPSPVLPRETITKENVLAKVEQMRSEISALRDLLIETGVIDRREFVERVMDRKRNPPESTGD